MQTKNVNLVQTGSHNEAQTVAFRSSLRGSSHDVRNSTQESEGNTLPVSSVYHPLPPTKNKHVSDVPNGYPSQPHQTSFAGPTEIPSLGGCKSSIYQPPPLPPRVGSASGRSNPQSPIKEWPKKEHVPGGILVNGSCGAYKPVPPPKPFAGSQNFAAHQQQQQQLEGNDPAHALHNGHGNYPHILVTEQGQFVTHSTKFPIVDENEKLVKMFNDANSSLNQGIDNPALVSDSSLGIVNQSQHKEMTPNHYAQMRPYDPSKYPPFLQNGHQPNFTRPSFIHPYQQTETNWQNHVPINSVRFSSSSVIQSPDKKTYVNGNSLNNQNSRERSYYHSPPQPQHNVVMKGNAGYDPGKNSPHYQDINMNPNDPNFKYSDMSGKAPNSQTTNGTIAGGGNHYANGYTIANGESNKQTSNNHEVSSSTTNESNDDIENKKEDKWGSLKRAGKKYSNFKNILSNKFTKNDPKLNSTSTSASLSTESKGTNSQDLPKNSEVESKGNLLNSERLHNGENHLQESRNFERIVTYGSLKAKLDDPPRQSYGPSLLMSSERQSDRIMRNPNGSFPSHCSYGNQVPNGGKQIGILSPKRAGSCSHLVAPASARTQQHSSWASLHRSDDNLTRPLASDQSYPEHNSLKPKDGAHVHFHSSREGGASGGSDSGRGTGGGSATEFKGHDTSLESGSSNRVTLHGHSSGNESEWIDIPETDGQKTSYRAVFHNGVKYPDGSRTPPLPPLSPEESPKISNRTSSKAKKQSNSFSSRETKKPDIIETTEQNGAKKSSLHVQGVENLNQSNMHRSTHIPPSSKGEWIDRNATTTTGREQGMSKSTNRFNEQSRNRDNEWRPFDNGKHFEDDELTSTDAALDLNSVLDGATEVTSDDELASTRDDDNYLIRRQLEGLEGMYSEVLKVLGGRRNVRHNDPRLSRRRTHGSVSSLPSSVMSGRATRDRKGKAIDDRLRKANKDISKTTHKRFQRLESHVVTLARSVAHLSSEMRTQHLMLQEMESIRNDLSALKMSVKPSSAPYARGGPFRGSRLWNGIGVGNPSWNNPGRVKKLTQFFGDEPPLVRIFLRKLGYEKYASIFEKEKIGMLELPYMTEDRLQKIGIPLGPRLRILEEARGPITTDGNLSVYVV